jgi:hypothetical protein
MKYAAEMRSCGMIYIHTKFHKDWFSLSEIDGEGERYTDTQIGDRMSLLLCFQNKESGLGCLYSYGREERKYRKKILTPISKE